MANPKPIALWAMPRSVSTAFERVFVERDDFEVFHEPFSASYYYGKQRRSDRFAGEEPQDEHRHERVLEEILAPTGKPVFIKDMAYHVAGFMSPEFVDGFTNTFIIREPRQALVSLYNMWPDFTFEEAGYEELHRLFGYAEGVGQEPAIVDADDLVRDPEGTVAAYCAKLSIEHKPEALSWEPREVPEWQSWDEWHEEAQNSTGLGEVSQEETTLPPELREVYKRCLPYYYELHEKRLRV